MILSLLGVIARKRAGAGPGAPTLVITEPFTYGTVELGLGSSGVWVVTKGGLATLSNEVASDGVSYGLGYHTTAVAANHRSEITITAAGTAFIGLAVRVQSSGENAYIAINSSGSLLLQKIIAGTATGLQTGTPLAPGDKLSLEASGTGAATRLKVQKDTGAGWVDVWTNEDPGASYLDGGFSGVAGFNLTDDSTGDDFKAYDLP